jgi:hypothetical protein
MSLRMDVALTDVAKVGSSLMICLNNKIYTECVRKLLQIKDCFKLF